jgi:hypothetical protein
MWRPRTEAEIQVGIETGTTVESSRFDAKVALPASGKNKDLAKEATGTCSATASAEGRSGSGQHKEAGAQGKRSGGWPTSGASQ